MLKKSLFLLLVLTFLPFPSARAESELIGDFVAPVTNSDGQIILATGAVLTGGILLFAKNWEKRIQARAYAYKPLGDKIDKLGDAWGQVLPNAAYAVGMYTHYLFTDQKRSEHLAVLMVESTGFAAADSTILKYSIPEQRPSGGKHSFPSGHATTAFAFASVVGANHPWYYGAAAYASAFVVAESRMEMNMHYLHDLIAGAAIGMSYGVSLSERFKERMGDLAVTITPADGLQGATLYVSGNLPNF